MLRLCSRLKAPAKLLSGLAPVRAVTRCADCSTAASAPDACSWNNHQTYYRCTYPSQYATANHISHPRAVYLREVDILPNLDAWLAKTLDPAHLPATLDDLASAQQREEAPEALRDQIRDCSRQLAKYRAALDADGDPAVVGPWITETQARKLAAESRLRSLDSTQTARRVTREESAHS